MEKRHKDRLRRLANAVERQVQDKWFNLNSYHGYASYTQFSHNEIIPPSNIAFFKHTCGTTGCLMGWAPSLLKSIEATPYKTRVKYKVEGCTTYDITKAGKKLFGLSEDQYFWLFMPSTYEDRWPEHRKGAVARIRAFLSVGGDMTKVDNLEYENF